ncbi:hypothetical protein BU24DRAFT_8048 [Aaosphaeria arxii CBS 175.79]|uniref:Uncharacterized protein n=1 Tax=Aaosphaeria arxii CBS 175.79 TaxID=1450172 RepID=A0A6A5Y5I4_9PLEO|nr:uncharacterized protein BU24DRAFT_8048 [Aaosphaeria arxii CBS 175.79]KAF2020758.1 hypothetical protein BU24DRAFT_8048 [Aaosphaeria arxii CBS 175.79]
MINVVTFHLMLSQRYLTKHVWGSVTPRCRGSVIYIQSSQRIQLQGVLNRLSYAIGVHLYAIVNTFLGILFCNLLFEILRLRRASSSRSRAKIISRTCTTTWSFARLPLQMPSPFPILVVVRD